MEMKLKEPSTANRDNLSLNHYLMYEIEKSHCFCSSSSSGLLAWMRYENISSVKFIVCLLSF